jgi:hypothetical protein
MLQQHFLRVITMRTWCLESFQAGVVIHCWRGEKMCAWLGWHQASGGADDVMCLLNLCVTAAPLLQCLYALEANLFVMHHLLLDFEPYGITLMPLDASGNARVWLT